MVAFVGYPFLCSALFVEDLMFVAYKLFSPHLMMKSHVELLAWRIQECYDCLGTHRSHILVRYHVKRMSAEDRLDVVCAPRLCNPKQSHNNATWTCPNGRLNPIDPVVKPVRHYPLTYPVFCSRRLSRVHGFSNTLGLIRLTQVLILWALPKHIG